MKNESRPTSPVRYDYESAAVYLGMSVRAVKRARESGALGCIKLGGLRVSFTQQQLDDYIESCTVPPRV